MQDKMNKNLIVLQLFSKKIRYILAEDFLKL